MTLRRDGAQRLQHCGHCASLSLRQLLLRGAPSRHLTPPYRGEREDAHCWGVSTPRSMSGCE